MKNDKEKCIVVKNHPLIRIKITDSYKAGFIITAMKYMKEERIWRKRMYRNVLLPSISQFLVTYQ